MRCEAAVAGHVGFHTSDRPVIDGRPPEQVVIECDGLRFVWHPGRTVDGGLTCPVVSVMSDDFETGIRATNRFLSALSFALHQPLPVIATAAHGRKGELDLPFLGQPQASTYALSMRRAPSRLEVSDDVRLRLVLAVLREGFSLEVPTYRFLTLHNALTAAFAGGDSEVNEFIDASVFEPPPAGQPSPFRWSAYMRGSLRNAVAHAVRIRPDQRALDPDDVTDRADLAHASEILDGVLASKINSEWPDAVRFRY